MSKQRRTADDFRRDMAIKQAWEKANGDALSAIKALRDSTGMGLAEAAKLIEESAKQLGKPYNVVLWREGRVTLAK